MQPVRPACAGDNRTDSHEQDQRGFVKGVGTMLLVGLPQGIDASGESSGSSVTGMARLPALEWTFLGTIIKTEIRAFSRVWLDTRRKWRGEVVGAFQIFGVRYFLPTQLIDLHLATVGNAARGSRLHTSGISLGAKRPNNRGG